MRAMEARVVSELRTFGGQHKIAPLPQWLCAVCWMAVAACIGLASLLLGCRAPQEEVRQTHPMQPTQPWGLPGADAANTRQVAQIGPAVPRLKWKAELTGPFPYGISMRLTAPLVSRNGDCMLANPWYTFCIEPDGTLRWILNGEPPPAGKHVRTKALLSDGAIIGTQRHWGTDFPWPTPTVDFLCKLDSDGSVLWKKKMGSLESRPVIDTLDRIYFVNAPVGRDGYRVTVMSAEGRTLREHQIGPRDWTYGWQIALREAGGSTWCYCLSESGALVMVEPNGAVKHLDVFEDDDKDWWETAALAVSQEHDAVYVLAYQGALYCVGANTLQIRWRLNVPGIAASHVAVAPRQVYVGGQTYDPYEGTPKEDRSFVADHVLCAISHDGTFLWKYIIPDKIGMAPAIDAAGSIYVTAFSRQDGDLSLHSIDPDGTEQWQCPLGKWVPADSSKELELDDELISPPAIGPDRTVYCYGNTVYAITDASVSQRTDEE